MGGNQGGTVVWQFLGWTDDTGAVVGDVTDGCFLDTAGRRTDPTGAGRVIPFTVPLRDSDTAPAALAGTRPEGQETAPVPGM